MLSQSANSQPLNLSRKERRLAKKNAQKGQLKIAVSADVEAAMVKAEAAEKSANLQLATGLFAQLFNSFPKVALAQFRAAQFFEANGRPDIAYLGFKNAVTLAPEQAEYWLALGIHLIRARQKEAAVIAYERASALRPDDAKILCDLAHAHMVNDDPKSAILAIDAALAQRPKHALSHFKRGAYLAAAGRFEESHSAFFKALELNPGKLSIYYHLSRSGAEIEAAETVVEKLEKGLPAVAADAEETSLYLFAIAKLKEKLGDDDDAFAAYQQANDYIFNRIDYRLEDLSKRYDVYREAYDAQVFEQMAPAGSDTKVPVFIIGMPRSGTTLVEQIIASHSQASGAGELDKISLLTQNLKATSQRDCVFPKNITSLEPGGLAKLGQEYLSFLHRKAPGDWQRITDKMPTNFIYLGLIKVLFPHAAIIHCKRDVLDTCISCFTTNFAHWEAMGFAFNLEVLGGFYREYERMMDHWYDVLPGRIFDVTYEDLIENQEAVSRNIIAHIQLDWEDECLNFHETSRGVQTASLWQVRQPIYKSSAGRWRRYEKHLGPLQKALVKLPPKLP